MNTAITAHSIRLQRSIGIAGRRRRVPRQAHWKPIQLDYTRRLLTLVQLAREVLAPLIAELPSLIASARSEREMLLTLDVVHFRRDAGEQRRVTELLKRARESLAQQMAPTQLERIAEEFANKTSEFNKTQLKRQTKAALGIDVFASDATLRSRMQGFVGENVSLIKSIPEDLVNDVEKVVFRGLARGVLAKDLAKSIDEEFQFGEKRAAIIARDQIGTFHGQLNAERQQSLGIRRFIWRTMHDDRVRDEHADREAASDPALGGEPYSFDDPPDGELPGTPINCRCFAEPVFGDILAEV